MSLQLQTTPPCFTLVCFVYVHLCLPRALLGDSTANARVGRGTAADYSLHCVLELLIIQSNKLWLSNTTLPLRNQSCNTLAPVSVLFAYMIMTPRQELHLGI